MGNTLRRAPCNRDARDAAEPPGNREHPFVLSQDQLLQCHLRAGAVRRLQNVGKRPRTVSLSVSLWPPAGRTKDSLDSWGAARASVHRLSPASRMFTWTPPRPSLPPPLPRPPLPIPTPGPPWDQPVVCLLKHPFHGRTFSRYVAVGSPDEGRTGKGHLLLFFFLPDVGCKYSRKPWASARTTDRLSPRSGCGPGDRPWVPLPPSWRPSGRRRRHLQQPHRLLFSVLA